MAPRALVLRSVDEPLWQHYLDVLEAAQQSSERGDLPARQNEASARAYVVKGRLLAVPRLLGR